MKAEIYNTRMWLTGTNENNIKKLINSILLNSGFTILSFVEYKFIPIGYTALWLLAESHCAVHTFPEDNKTYVELSSCNEKMQILFCEQCSMLNVLHCP